MRPPSETHRYSLAAALLHWASAILILANGGIGLWMTRVAGPGRFEAYQLHKALGLALLAMAVFRLIWRLGHRPPPPVGSAMERALAGFAHGAFYALMLGLPLVGWLAVSASPLALPTTVWGLAVPDLPLVRSHLLSERLATLHAGMAWAMTGLLVLHVAAALRHQAADPAYGGRLTIWGRG